jgi:CRP-like cAMP-binding protein
MQIESLYLAEILNRALDRAAQHLTVEKLLLQLGLDPSNITFHAIFQRLLDIAVANTNFANMFALLGAGFYAATLLMRTMVPLRVLGIVSALFFMAYGALAGAISTFFMYLLLLPINSLRLFQMRNLVKKARVAAQGDLSMDWLKPFMNRRHYRHGDVLFRKGQPADEMYLTVTGKFLVAEIGVELPPGRLMGELGFVTPNNRRTQTVRCIEDGEVLAISYDRLLEIYFENPEFGYYFLRLASDRLLQNNARLEGIIAAAADATAADSQQPDDKATAAKEIADAATVAREAAAKAAAEKLAQERHAHAVKAVERYALWSGAAGLIPLPFLDLAAVGGLQIQMLRRVSRTYGVPFSENRGKALIVGLAGSMIPASSGIGAASLTKSVPIVGTIIGSAVMPALSAAATYAIGMAFIQHFASGGTLFDFNPADYREFVKAQKERWSIRSKKSARAARRAATLPARAAKRSRRKFRHAFRNWRDYFPH